MKDKKKIEIIYMDTDKLIPYVNNPRDNENAIDKVASSIKNFGFKQPIVVDADNEIIAGHTRLLASKKLGLEQVPVIVADDLSDVEVKAFRLADNKVAELSDWNLELLELEFEELRNKDVFTGFEDFEIDGLLNDIDVDEFFETTTEQQEREEEPKTVKCPYCGKEFEA